MNRNPWIEAMRLRTLPVSASGVVIAVALAYYKSGSELRVVPAMLCLVFALLAQVVSNFANEYYDYVAGIDKKGREGFRRGVTEGDITPGALKRATYGTLAVACAVGCGLIPYGGWWLIPVGLIIALGALAYSTGPYPLSRHGFGELAVFIFYGLIPVNFTYYLTSGRWDALAVLASIAIGLMGVNVLLVNNIRDEGDDREAGKRTSVVIFGRRPALMAYALNGVSAMAFLTPIWLSLAFVLFINNQASTPFSLRVVKAAAVFLPAFIYLIMHTATTLRLKRGTGHELNPVLGATARNMLIFTLLFALLLILAI